MPREPHLHAFGFPVRFELWFWISALFIGLRGADHIGYALLWVGLVTFSILVHELGHAFAYRHYGTESSISMHGLGGATRAESAGHLHAKQRIVVSAAGAVTEMILLGLPAWILMQTWSPFGLAGLVLQWLFWINVVWALVNLVPASPMDGGHIFDELVYLKTGEHKPTLVSKVSIATSVVMIVIGLLNGLTFMAFLFGYMIYINLGRLGIVGNQASLTPNDAGGYLDRNGTYHSPEPRTSKRSIFGGSGKSESKKVTPDWAGAGFASLRSNNPREAMEHAANAIRTSKKVGERRLAGEVIVWSWLHQNRLDRANVMFEDLDSPTLTLQAILRVENGDDHGGIAQLAAAVQAESDHPSSIEAVLHVTRSGHLKMLVGCLLAEGTPAAKGHVVRIESILSANNLSNESAEVARLH